MCCRPASLRLASSRHSFSPLVPCTTVAPHASHAPHMHHSTRVRELFAPFIERLTHGRGVLAVIVMLVGSLCRAVQLLSPRAAEAGLEALLGQLSDDRIGSGERARAELGVDDFARGEGHLEGGAAGGAFGISNNRCIGELLADGSREPRETGIVPSGGAVLDVNNFAHGGSGDGRLLKVLLFGNLDQAN
eukprot:TRINITY_DN1944_c0_g2_i3.p1 TRINITY_DN1944_c0_g2~~TRINITY_DN1944_c0_g2_i3.p1  ORF type:complete len:190 (+),score=16.86 TRINITY_DN1944_c0_g2_i3:481-1050(+)